MKNAEINKSRRWNRFVQLNADDYYCTTSLATWAETGQYNGYTDPKYNKSDYKRIQCGRCDKCDSIENIEIGMSVIRDWKRKAYDLAKEYGRTLYHLDELKIENVNLKAENKMLFDILKAGVSETNMDIFERIAHIHRDHTAVYSSSDPEDKK